MLLEVKSGSFGWLNNNVSDGQIPSQYKNAWSSLLKGNVKAINEFPFISQNGGTVKIGKNSIILSSGSQYFAYKGKLKIKKGKLVGGRFTEYERSMQKNNGVIESVRLSGIDVPAKEMIRSIPFLTLPQGIKDLVLTYSGKAPGYSGDLLPGAYGYDGNDDISGDYNYIRGGVGDDRLGGSSSANVFIFESPDKNGVDTITNFSRSEGDKIQISLANNYSGGFSYGQFVRDSDPSQIGFSNSDTFSSTDERFHLNSSTGHLLFDPDGSGNSYGARHLATLVGVTQLGVEDFQFVY